MSTSAIVDEDLSVTTIAEEYLQAVRSGHAIPIEVFAARYPKLAHELEEELPMLLLMEELKSSRSQVAYVEKKSAPTEIGCYRLLEEIGRGGMGQVFAGIDKVSRTEVAIKVLALDGQKRVNGVKRFRREATTGGNLKHPNIVPIFEFSEENDFVYLVMPRIYGINLAEIIQQNSDSAKTKKKAWANFSVTQVAEIGASVASALAHAHAKDYVHRDIKPANILLEASGHVWVTDFGLVKSLELHRSLSCLGDVIGTPRYMAPEQLRGSCDGRSDIYSLGITLYELATGRKASSKARQSAFSTGPQEMKLVPIRELRPEVPESLAFIITKCCALNPEDRYQTALELEVVLRRFLEGKLVGDRRKMSHRNRHILKRRSCQMATLVLVLLMAIGCAALAVHYASGLTASAYILRKERLDLSSIPKEVGTNDYA